ncbi:helix-turn-helix transcriptional regulator [[Pasteurella] aerogenes]|nr:helix-turn-helix transcriptional regulator [[Pasteurella] aerogenes]
MGKAKINDTKFGERMTYLLKHKFGNNNSKFARDVGVAITSLNRWLTGEADPSRSNLIKIAEATGVSLEWLALGKETSPVRTHEDDNEPNYNGYEDIDDFRHISVSAGFGAFNDDNNSNEKVKIESSWLESRRLKAKDCAMFSVDGDSMYPTLKDGEEIVIDRSKKELREGKIFVLNHMGTMWVKRVRVNYDSIELISDNNFYNPITITQDEAEQLNVIGQVVRGYRDF